MLARHLQKLPGSPKRIRDAVLRYTYLLNSAKKRNARKNCEVSLFIFCFEKFIVQIIHTFSMHLKKVGRFSEALDDPLPSFITRRINRREKNWTCPAWLTTSKFCLYLPSNRELSDWKYIKREVYGKGIRKKRQKQKKIFEDAGRVIGFVMKSDQIWEHFGGETRGRRIIIWSALS